MDEINLLEKVSNLEKRILELETFIEDYAYDYIISNMDGEYVAVDYNSGGYPYLTKRYDIAMKFDKKTAERYLKGYSEKGFKIIRMAKRKS